MGTILVRDMTPVIFKKGYLNLSLTIGSIFKYNDLFSSKYNYWIKNTHNLEIFYSWKVQRFLYNHMNSWRYLSQGNAIISIWWKEWCKVMQKQFYGPMQWYDTLKALKSKIDKFFHIKCNRVILLAVYVWSWELIPYFFNTVKDLFW